jgi:putative ATPase
MALVVAVAAAQAFEQVGMPEGYLTLSQAVLYLANAPKSNSVLAVYDAVEDVKKGRYGPVPVHLRDAHYPGAEDMGHGKGYLYPHDYPGHWIQQEYLPEALRGRVYYKPAGTGLESNLSAPGGRKSEDETGQPRGETKRL